MNRLKKLESFLENLLLCFIKPFLNRMNVTYFQCNSVTIKNLTLFQSLVYPGLKSYSLSGQVQVKSYGGANTLKMSSKFSKKMLHEKTLEIS